MPIPFVKRADAQRNRATILAAAQEMFAADGLGVSVDEIARRAQVGVGTFYRHFPTKDSLVAAIVIERIARVADRAEDLLREGDAGAALFGLLDYMVTEGAHKRDFIDVLGAKAWLETPAADEAKQRFRKALAKLLARAQKQGHVRADVRRDDLTALVRGVLAADAKTRARLLTIIIAGLRA